MALLQDWSPFRELEKFRRDFDDLFERLTGYGPVRGREREAFVPALESFIEGGKIVVRIDVPGIDPKDIEVKVAGDLLTVRGSREEKTEKKKRDFIQREVHYGSFVRTLKLPEGVKADDIKATYSDGVLELTAPVPRELGARQVKVSVEAGEKKPEAKEQKTA